MYKHILVPLDNSPTDDVILNHVRPLARLLSARICLVHVAEQPVTVVAVPFLVVRCKHVRDARVRVRLVGGIEQFA